eukprot:10987518-Karenia_brevis.AAC.1
MVKRLDFWGSFLTCRIPWKHGGANRDTCLHLFQLHLQSAMQAPTGRMLSWSMDGTAVYTKTERIILAQDELPNEPKWWRCVIITIIIIIIIIIITIVII